MGTYAPEESWFSKAEKVVPEGHRAAGMNEAAPATSTCAETSREKTRASPAWTPGKRHGGQRLVSYKEGTFKMAALVNVTCTAAGKCKAGTAAFFRSASRGDNKRHRLSLLVPSVKVTNACWAHDPATRSVDVQQSAWRFTGAVEPAPASSKHSSVSSCGFLSCASGSVVKHCALDHVAGAGAAVSIPDAGAGERAEETGGVSSAGEKRHRVSVSHVLEFRDLALDTALLKSLRLQGLRVPSPVQCALLSRALEGKDLVVQAKSGTGKTLAFALYLLHALAQHFKACLAELGTSSSSVVARGARRYPCFAGGAGGKNADACTAARACTREKEYFHKEPSISSASLAAADADCIAMALVVTPTRELTIQVANEINRLGWCMQQPRLRHACLFGGRPLSVCQQQLAEQPHMLISTPGRLLSLMRNKAIIKIIAAWPRPGLCATNALLPEDSLNIRQFSAEQQPSRNYCSCAGKVICASRDHPKSHPSVTSEGTTSHAGGDGASEGLRDGRLESVCGRTLAAIAERGEQLPGSHLQKRLRVMVLDEADMLLDHFFRGQIKKLLSALLHPSLQVIATSATFPQPSLTFLEGLCHSVTQDQCQRLATQALSPSEPYWRLMEGSDSFKTEEPTQDAGTFLDLSTAAVTFVREHGATTAGQGRRTVVGAYVNRLINSFNKTSHFLQCKASFPQLEAGGRNTVLDAAAGYPHHHAEALQTGDNAFCPAGTEALHVIDSVEPRQLRRAKKEPRTFERLLLCSSFIVHGANSSSTHAEPEASGPRPYTAPGNSSHTTSFDSEPRSATPAVLQKTALPCGISESEQVKWNEQTERAFEPADEGATVQSPQVPVAVLPGKSVEQKAFVLAPNRSASAREDSSLFTGVRETGADAVFTVENGDEGPSGKGPTGNDVPDVHLRYLKSLQSAANASRRSGPSHRRLFPPIAGCVQLEGMESTERQDLARLEEAVKDTANKAFSCVERRGKWRDTSSLPAREKHRAESPVLAGMQYLIMTVPDERSVMRQLGAKVRALQHILTSLPFRQAMVFCNKAEAGAQIAACLVQLGVPTLYTSSKLTQEYRVRNFLALKRVDCRVFVCSDMMSRGIDALAVDLVVNLDIPRDKEIFLHRSGRAGRFGGNGVCICVASEDERPTFDYLAKALQLDVSPFSGSVQRKTRVVQEDVALARLLPSVPAEAHRQLEDNGDDCGDNLRQNGREKGFGHLENGARFLKGKKNDPLQDTCAIAQQRVASPRNVDAGEQVSMQCPNGSGDGEEGTAKGARACTTSEAVEDKEEDCKQTHSTTLPHEAVWVERRKQFGIPTECDICKCTTEWPSSRSKAARSAWFRRLPRSHASEKGFPERQARDGKRWAYPCGMDPGVHQRCGRVRRLQAHRWTQSLKDAEVISLLAVAALSARVGPPTSNSQCSSVSPFSLKAWNMEMDMKGQLFRALEALPVTGVQRKKQETQRDGQTREQTERQLEDCRREDACCLRRIDADRIGTRRPYYSIADVVGYALTHVKGIHALLWGVS